MGSGAIVNGHTDSENGATVNFHLNFPAGLGLSFNLQPSLTIIGKYFQVKRPIANGLAMAGSPVFLCTLAPLNQFLFERFGWRGSFFILGAMLLNCCVAGSLMRPLNDGRPASFLVLVITEDEVTLRYLEPANLPGCRHHDPAITVSLISVIAKEDNPSFWYFQGLVNIRHEKSVLIQPTVEVPWYLQVVRSPFYGEKIQNFSV